MEQQIIIEAFGGIASIVAAIIYMGLPNIAIAVWILPAIIGFMAFIQ